MQEHRPDGDKFTERVTDADFFRALQDKRNTAVTLHKTGSVVTMKDGRRYMVDKDGCFRRLPEQEVSDGE